VKDGERERYLDVMCASVHPPSSSQIGHGKHSPKVLHEDDSAGAEVRSDGDVEASIAVEQSGVGPIQRDTLQSVGRQLHVHVHVCTCMYRLYLSVDYEYWDFGAIFAGIERLTCFEQRCVKSFHFNPSKLLQTKTAS
jgi:hypothetical protein